MGLSSNLFFFLLDIKIHMFFFVAIRYHLCRWWCVCHFFSVHYDLTYFDSIVLTVIFFISTSIFCRFYHNHSTLFFVKIHLWAISMNKNTENVYISLTHFFRDSSAGGQLGARIISRNISKQLYSMVHSRRPHIEFNTFQQRRPKMHRICFVHVSGE